MTFAGVVNFFEALLHTYLKTKEKRDESTRSYVIQTRETDELVCENYGKFYCFKPDGIT